MSHEIDISGQRFGALTAIKPIGKNKSNQIVWHLSCECGNETTSTVGKLRSGSKTSCGCGIERTNKRKETLNTTEYFKKALNHTFTSNTSGVRGVSFNKQFQKWEASITFRGKRKHLGRFVDFNDAEQARKPAEQDLLNNK